MKLKPMVAGVIIGYSARFLWEKLTQAESKMDTQFTGAFPRGTGAVSAVTGGNPEDINMMPAAANPDKEGPVYDGHDLDQAV